MRPLLVLLPLCLLACVGPDHIEVDPAGPRFTHRGETLRLHGRTTDRNGKVYGRDRAFFRSRDPKVAAVNEHGDLTAVGSGHTVVEARAGSLYAEIPVEVDLVERLQASASHLSLSIEDEPLPVPVAALGRDGAPRKDREVELTSDDPNIARVDPLGRIWGVTPGDTLIKARVEDKLAVIAVHVTGEKTRTAAHRVR